MNFKLDDKRKSAMMKIRVTGKTVTLMIVLGVLGECRLRAGKGQGRGQ